MLSKPTTPQMTGRIFAYLRVSTGEQVESGAGLNAQHDACRAWAARSGGELVSEYRDEGVSGAAPLEARKGLLEALGELKAGDVLLVAKRDRLARDPIVLAMIEAAVTRRKARIVSAAGEGTEGDGPSDVLMRRIVDAFAEYERLVIRARTKAALVAKKARGERTGSIPYGAQLAEDGVHLQPIPQEQRVIALARALRAQERSLRVISAELARRGFLARNGRPFLPPQIARMLQS